MNASILIRRMGAGDLPFADRIRSATGWNQTENDWRRFMAHDPEGCFVAELDGSPAGTATTTCYGGELAWIGMVLVDPDLRRRGVGRALLLHAIEYLRGLGIPCIKLDATPLGKQLYDRLGFQVEWGLSRWETDGIPVPPPSEAPSIRPVPVVELGRLARIDAEAFGADRLRMLRLMAENGARMVTAVPEDREHGAYGFLRSGSLASYLGPVVAPNPKAGTALVTRLAASVSNERLFWDIPDSNSAAVGLAEQLGFRRQRRLVRMFLGENRSPSDPSLQFAIGGPEIG